jgi:uncharacterized protein (UPF0147 family)
LNGQLTTAGSGSANDGHIFSMSHEERSEFTILKSVTCVSSVPRSVRNAATDVDHSDKRSSKRPRPTVPRSTSTSTAASGSY